MPAFLLKRILLAVSLSSLAIWNNGAHAYINSQHCLKSLTGKELLTCKQALDDNPDAQYKLARLYAGQLSPAHLNLRQSFYWHRRLARQALKHEWKTERDAETMYNTGVFYADGVGTNRHMTNAFFWFEKAAALGQSFAMVKVAKAYIEGIGTDINTDLGLSWLHKAVELNNTSAKIALAKVYADGLIIKQNSGKAIELLKQAIEQHSADAVMTLAHYYRDGTGIETNIITAKKLYSDACKMNLLIACKHYHALDIAEAAALVHQPEVAQQFSQTKTKEVVKTNELTITVPKPAKEPTITAPKTTVPSATPVVKP